MASLDYANTAEDASFGTDDFNKIVDGLIAKENNPRHRERACLHRRHAVNCGILRTLALLACGNKSALLVNRVVPGQGGHGGDTVQAESLRDQ